MPGANPACSGPRPGLRPSRDGIETVPTWPHGGPSLCETPPRPPRCDWKETDRRREPSWHGACSCWTQRRRRALQVRARCGGGHARPLLPRRIGALRVADPAHRAAASALCPAFPWPRQSALGSRRRRRPRPASRRVPSWARRHPSRPAPGAWNQRSPGRDNRRGLPLPRLQPAGRAEGDPRARAAQGGGAGGVILSARRGRRRCAARARPAR